jgi:hypothetical protein
VGRPCQNLRNDMDYYILITEKITGKVKRQLGPYLERKANWIADRYSARFKNSKKEVYVVTKQDERVQLP